MDRHGIELQLKLIRITYRREAAGFSGEALAAFRDRAQRILAGVEEQAADDEQLQLEIERLRREIAG